MARGYDRQLYGLRHLVENGFERLKEWGGVAWRYAPKAAAYLTICQIRALAMWARVICTRSRQHWQGALGVAGAVAVGAVQQQGDGAVVFQLDLHMGLELAGGGGQAGLLEH